MLAFTLPALLPLLVPVLALADLTIATDPAPADPTDLYNGDFIAPDLTFRKANARDDSQATFSGARSTLSVCGDYKPSDFGQSCTTAADPDGPGGTCCTDSPGGLFALTQFWDADETSTGPNNSWTIHGLWPDKCDATWEEYCGRNLTTIRSILVDNDQTDLLSYMDIYWKSDRNGDDYLWTHEWNKHGTCISSLKKACYTEPRENAGLVTYFQRAVSTFQSLPTYDWLAADGIVPKLNATYTRAQILSALTKAYGFTPVIKCRSGALNEVWYYYNSKGGVVDGSMIKTDAVGYAGNCNPTGIRYMPKYTVSPGPRPNPPTTDPTVPAIIGAPLSAAGIRGFVYPTYSNDTRENRACLVRTGAWYKGTCAGYTSVKPPADSPAGSFQLKTNGGLCGILDTDNRLSCADTFTADTAAVFEFDDKGKMSIAGGEAFGSARVPGTEQVPVFWGSAQAVKFSLVYAPQ